MINHNITSGDIRNYTGGRQGIGGSSNVIIGAMARAIVNFVELCVF